MKWVRWGKHHGSNTTNVDFPNLLAVIPVPHCCKGGVEDCKDEQNGTKYGNYQKFKRHLGLFGMLAACWQAY